MEMNVTIFPVRLEWDEVNDKYTKKPGISGWQTSLVRKDQIHCPNYGVMMPDGVVGIDLDTYKNPELRRILNERFDAGLSDATMVQKTIKGGEHHLFSVSAGAEIEQGSDVKDIVGFDTRCSGRGWLCTGEGYESTCGMPLEQAIAAELPPLAPRLLEALTVTRGEVIQMPAREARHDGRVDMDELTSALFAIDPDVNYDDWYKIGMALWHVPSGFDLFDQWSSGGSKYDMTPKEMNAKWESFAGNTITPKTIFYMAQKHGWKNPAKGVERDNGGLDDLEAIEGDGERVGKDSIWNDYVFLTHSSTVRRISTGAEMKPDAFNKVIPPEMRMVPKNDKGEMKVIPAVDYLTHVVGRAAVHTSLYLPWADTFFTYQGNPCVNSYLPSSCPEPAGIGWREHWAWQLVEAHLMQLVDSEAEGRLLIQWLAHNVQNPGVKILWAIIICGLEGDGKSSIANILKHVMGPENVRDVLPSDLRSDFNSFASGSCVVAMEEIALSDSKKYDKHEVMDRIKPLITNPVVSVTRKYQDAVQAPNTTNYIAFTNNKAALPLSKGDRRWHVMYTRFKDRNQLLAECPQDTYFNPFHEAYQNHPDVIRAWLESIDLSDFNRHVGPAINESKLAMIEASESDDVHAAREVVEELDGVFTMGEFLDRLKQYNITRTAKRGGDILKELGYQKTGRVRVKMGGLTRLWFCSSCGTDDDLTIRDIYDNKSFDLL